MEKRFYIEKSVEIVCICQIVCRQRVEFFLLVFFFSNFSTDRRASLANGQQTMPEQASAGQASPGWSNKPHSRPDHVVQTDERTEKESRLTSSGTKGA